MTGIIELVGLFNRLGNRKFKERIARHVDDRRPGQRLVYRINGRLLDIFSQWLVDAPSLIVGEDPTRPTSKRRFLVIKDKQAPRPDLIWYE